MPELQEFKSDWTDNYGVPSLFWFVYKKDHVCYHEWGGVQEKIMMQFKEAGLCQRDIKGLWSAENQHLVTSGLMNQIAKVRSWKWFKKSSNDSSVNEHLQDTGVHVSSVKKTKASEESVQDARCCWSSKHRKARLQFTQTNRQSSETKTNPKLPTMVTERGNCEEAKEKLTAQKPPHHLSNMPAFLSWAGFAWLPVEPAHWHLLMILLLTGRSNRMNAEVYGSAPRTQIQPNASKVIGQRYIIIQQDEQPMGQSRSPDLNLTELKPCPWLKTDRIKASARWCLGQRLQAVTDCKSNMFQCRITLKGHSSNSPTSTTMSYLKLS